MRLRTCNGFLDYCDRRKQTHSYLCSVCLKDCNGVNTIFFCVVFHQIACYRISYHTLAQESSSQMGDANEERVVYTNRSSILLKSSHTVDPVERPASIIVFGFTIKDNIMYPRMYVAFAVRCLRWHNNTTVIVLEFGCMPIHLCKSRTLVAMVLAATRPMSLLSKPEERKVSHGSSASARQSSRYLYCVHLRQFSKILFDRDSLKTQILRRSPVCCAIP